MKEVREERSNKINGTCHDALLFVLSLSRSELKTFASVSDIFIYSFIPKLTGSYGQPDTSDSG